MVTGTILPENHNTTGINRACHRAFRNGKLITWYQIGINSVGQILRNYFVKSYFRSHINKYSPGITSLDHQQ